MTVPPGDPFRADLHLQKACGVVWCYTGEPADAEAAFAPVRELEPRWEGIGSVPYPALQSAFDALYPKHLYPIDGAVDRVGPADTAWSHRDATWSEVIVGVDPDPRNAAAITRWTVDYWEASHPYSAGGAYVNFMMDDEGADRVRATYGDNYDRLAEVKAAYDPDNILRINQNIPPLRVAPIRRGLVRERRPGRGSRPGPARIAAHFGRFPAG
jgi:hypothetical protein